MRISNLLAVFQSFVAAMCLVSNTFSDMIRVMRSGVFSFNNGDIYYEVGGSGHPIVFIHGFSLDHRMWRPQVKILSKSHQVITYDMRGFGKSSLPTGRYSHHQDLKALLDHLGIKQTHLIGLSLGGEVAIDFTITHPEMANSLILLESSLGGYASTVDWDVRAVETGVDKAKVNWLNHPVFAQSVINPLARKALEEAMSDYSGWHWFNSDPRTKLRPRAMEQLANVKTPTLIAVGNKDLSYYHDIAKILHSTIRGSQLAYIADAGHMVNIEKANEINKLISNFITQS